MLDRPTAEYWGDLVGIAAGLVAISGWLAAIGVWLYNRTPRPSVRVCIDRHYASDPPVLSVKIINDSATDLTVVEPAFLVVDDPRYASSVVRQFNRQRVDDGNTQFPRQLGKQSQIVSRESMSQLGDDLRMADCWESCLVRGMFRDALDRPLHSPRYIFPVSDWLEADAGAHRHTPTGPQRTDFTSRLKTWWARHHARPLRPCPRWM